MATGRKTGTRTRQNTQHHTVHSYSMDLSHDVNFSIGYPNIDDPLLLLTNRTVNSSFSTLCKRSKDIEWKQVLIEERDIAKTKSKRFMLNRSIQACSENADIINQNAQQLNNELKIQLSTKLPLEQNIHDRLPTPDAVFNEIKLWMQLQSERRLWKKEYNYLCNFVILQQHLTDHFINLVNSSAGQDALTELFNHCLIIVDQPCGTDCIAVTKYEKEAGNYLSKIKTRIICLLDPKRIGQCFKPTTIDVTLYPHDAMMDPNGDPQTSLEWREQSIMTDDGERLFWYCELNENDTLHLTKLNPKKRPLYNGGLCRLKFTLKFEITIANRTLNVISLLTSQPFGLCSHTKYCPKMLAKVFIEEMKTIGIDVSLNNHINTLMGYICELHKRIAGVEVKRHSQQFILQELHKVKAPKSSTTEPKEVTWKDYENILEKLFNQIKFLGTHPFLAMMYHDGLFGGISADIIDDRIRQGTVDRPIMFMRFELPPNDNSTGNPNITVVIYNGKLSIATITHENFIDSMDKCFYEAAENRSNQALIFADDRFIPFRNLQWYYDADLNHHNFRETQGKRIYNSFDFLLQDTMVTNRDGQLTTNVASNRQDLRTTSHEQSQQISNEQITSTQKVTLSLEVTGNNPDALSNLITLLQNTCFQYFYEQRLQGFLTETTTTELLDDDTFSSQPLDDSLNIIDRYQ